MNSLGTSTIILLSEINVLFLVATGIATAIYFNRRQRDNDALNALAARLRDEYPARLATARERLEAGGRQTGEDVEREAQHLVQREYALYKRFMDIYAARDSAAVQDLDAAVSEVVAGYQALLAAPPGGQDGADPEEVEQLRSENQGLQEELNRARQDRDSTLTEYASAFGADDAAQEETATAGDAPDDSGAAAPEADAETDMAAAMEAAASATEAPDAAESDADAEQPAATGQDDGDDFDDALESLNLDDIDLGLDEPNRNTG